MLNSSLSKNVSLKIKFILLVFSIVYTLLGCGSEDSKDKSQNMQSLEFEEQSGKVSEQLKSIESNIEKIIGILDGPTNQKEIKSEKSDKQESKKPTQSEEQKKENIESSGQTNKNEGSNNDESSGDKKQNNENGDNKSDTKTESIGDNQKQTQTDKNNPWDNIGQIINTLHYQWNNYMPATLKKNASKSLTENFSSALNSLTSTIISKNKTNTLMAASFLYAYIPDFYALYGNNTSSEIKRIQHYIRNSILNALTANWEQSQEDVKNLKSHWQLYKNIIDKSQQNEVAKLDLSILEFEKVIEQKNQPLIDIKGRVAMSNIYTFEKSMEKQSEQQAPDKEDTSDSKENKKSSKSNK